MKAIILAGGTGSRLHPLTKITNKHLLPVGKYPMIFHPIFKLKQAGLTDIMLITGKERMGDMVNLLGSGSDIGVYFTYRVQEDAGGIAQALGLAEQFAAGEPMVVILGDNVFEDDISPYVEHFREQGGEDRLLLQEVDDPGRFGVAELHGSQIASIVEKPSEPKSSFAVTGIYMHDSAVFEFIKTLKPSGRGELEITDINNDYIRRELLSYDILQGWWTDAGTHVSLARANELARTTDFGPECGIFKS